MHNRTTDIQNFSNTVTSTPTKVHEGTNSPLNNSQLHVINTSPFIIASWNLSHCNYECRARKRDIFSGFTVFSVRAAVKAKGRALGKRALQSAPFQLVRAYLKLKLLTPEELMYQYHDDGSLNEQGLMGFTSLENAKEWVKALFFKLENLLAIEG